MGRIIRPNCSIQVFLSLAVFLSNGCRETAAGLVHRTELFSISRLWRSADVILVGPVGSGLAVVLVKLFTQLLPRGLRCGGRIGQYPK